MSNEKGRDNKMIEELVDNKDLIDLMVKQGDLRHLNSSRELLFVIAEITGKLEHKYKALNSGYSNKGSTHISFNMDIDSNNVKFNYEVNYNGDQ